MVGKIAVVMCILFVALAFTDANPVIDSAGEFDLVGVCLRNCAQCKKMYGSYFEGQMCADGCVKFKGKVIPDCEDIGSIAPFLNKF
ncbi:eclosion hormone [Contarinia nasturtii]|uniref:eclosion hormone n=1 Tax=Contarinia nasturtii TaxID=265458 RepID=UPI0012D3A2E0|nr:eclosion hormone [Contarinia nasturtii]